jgi:hypothetical protein
MLGVENEAFMLSINMLSVVMLSAVSLFSHTVFKIIY